jgi:hypothetical protein
MSGSEGGNRTWPESNTLLVKGALATTPNAFGAARNHRNFPQREVGVIQID